MSGISCETRAFPRGTKREGNTHLQSFLLPHMNARVVLREIQERKRERVSGAVRDGVLQGTLFDRPGEQIPSANGTPADPLSRSSSSRALVRK